MAQAETLVKVDIKSQLNSFLNKVFRAGDVDTPFIKCAGEHTSTKTLVEWGIEELTKPTVISAPRRSGEQFRAPSGEDSTRTPNASNIPEKGVNVHQINSRIASVEIPLKDVKQIGNTKEFRLQVTKHVIRLRQEMEIVALGHQYGHHGTDIRNQVTYRGAWVANTAYIVGDHVLYKADLYKNIVADESNTPPPMLATSWTKLDNKDYTASASTYLRTNVSRGEDSSDPDDHATYGFPSAAGDFTTGGNPLSFKKLADVQDSIFKNSNRSCPLVLGSMEAKKLFFLHLVDGKSVRVGTEYRDIDYDLKKFESMSADYIVTEQGSFLLCPNNFMPTATTTGYLFFFNPDYWKISYLKNRKLKHKMLSAVGDTVDMMILNDWAVIAGNQEANGAIFELAG